MLSFDGISNVEAVFNALRNTGCDLVGVSAYAPEKCTATCRRANAKRKFVMNVCPITDIYTIKTVNNKHSDFNSNLVHLLNGWLRVGHTVAVNFAINEPRKSMTSRDLDAKWTSVGLTNEQIEWSIIDAEEKVKLKKPRTEEEYLASVMGRSILRARRDNTGNTNQSSHKLPADSPQYVNMEDFLNLDTVMCKSINVLTGEMIQFPLTDWITSKHYVQYTLVLHGMASAGKTEWAKRVLGNLAQELCEDGSEDAYFVKVESMDNLREADQAGLMKRGVPVLLDEISPLQSKMSLEDIKHVAEVAGSTTVKCRYRDAKFLEHQPRIFTSNASSPSLWHACLPSGVFESSNEARNALNADVKACFKRICFAEVTVSLITDEARARHEATRRA